MENFKKEIALAGKKPSHFEFINLSEITNNDFEEPDKEINFNICYRDSFENRQNQTSTSAKSKSDEKEAYTFSLNNPFETFGPNIKKTAKTVFKVDKKSYTIISSNLKEQCIEEAKTKSKLLVAKKYNISTRSLNRWIKTGTIRKKN